ncbi:MAG: hypothetical protein ACYC7D_01195 [Nitrososphaerales archaeon]
MKNLAAFSLLLLIIASPSSSIAWQSGISNQPSNGYTSYNIDPTLSNASLNGLIFDPNFIPGFQSGLPNTSIYFSTGQDYANIGYSVGPWNETYYQVPHLAVGPQNSNFQEIPRTQQFRMLSWGDYYTVKAAFLPPAVNLSGYNASFQLTEPIYVGLRTDWQWQVQLSMNWHQPKLLDQGNQWAAIGLVTTEYVPSAPSKLVYTIIDFWMDENSSTFGSNPSSIDNYSIVRSSSTSVTYHPLQLAAVGNVTLNLNLTKYTDETLKFLGFPTIAGQPPVLSYTFLSVEGYNFQWNGTLYSFFDMTNSSSHSGVSVQILVPALIVLLVATSAGIYVFYRRRSTSNK